MPTFSIWTKGLILLGILFCLWSAHTIAQSSFVLSLEDDLIQYQAAPKDDPIAKLQQSINRGEVHLEYTQPGGYLHSVLKQLHISESSQVLVFSKTSFQQHLISPQAPRALYFNDDVYIGWVLGGEVMEVSAVDPNRGAMFYTLDQRKSTVPKFTRREECIQCHASPNTLGVPGHIVRSVYPDKQGIPQLQAGSFRTDHTSPLKERWGGWYVTGTHGSQRHMGNNFVTDKDHPENLDLNVGANITNLGKLVDLAAYAQPHSDIVALMVLEHQVRMHNTLTRVNWETRMAISQQEAMNRALGQPLDQWSDATRRRIFGTAEQLVRYILFSEETKLVDPVKGTSNFAVDFASIGPRDRNGRSLRDLDLNTRLLRYPCSYLIYSEAFDELPKPALDYVFRRLWDVLTEKDHSHEFSSLSSADRKAIFEILSDTKANLPDYWKLNQTTSVAHGSNIAVR